MKKPILVVMAAGMGSRYGGLKQMDPMGDHGEVIMDYSLFDARRAGFETVVFIIKKEMEQDFREKIGDRIAHFMQVRYAFQELDRLPEGFSVPEGRVKPWGTSHAVLCAREVIDAPFAVCNADDYYGPEAFRAVYQYLLSARDDEKYRFCMVGYRLSNTVTAHGSVARGVCELNGEGKLACVTERTRIETSPEGIRFTEDDGATWTRLPDDTPVSMNFWGFGESILRELDRRMPENLSRILAENPLKGEYYLPTLVKDLLAEELAEVEVLPTPDQWHGVTYLEDKPGVVAALKELTRSGLYPSPLWN